MKKKIMYQAFAVLAVFMSAATGAETLTLEAPGFQAAKITGVQAIGDAFPADEAGICAYAKVDQTVDIDATAPVFSEVIDVGDNFILGLIPVNNFGGTTHVKFYADTNGWLVAYLEKSEPVATIMQWLPADKNNPQISTIPRNVLTDALNDGGNAAGVGFLPQIKYYNFRFPEANHLVILVKTVSTEGSKHMQIELPTSYILYGASYYFYGIDAKQAELNVDGTLIYAGSTGNNGSLRNIDFFRGAIGVGLLHTIDVSYAPQCDWSSCADAGSVGVATALVYQIEE